jgi:hypothetical protein
MFNLLQILLYVMEGVAAVTAFIYMKKWKDTYWKWFPWYLLFIVIGEITGSYFTAYKMYVAVFDLCMYILIPVEFLFFFWIFYKAFKAEKIRWLPIACALVYCVCLVTDVVFFRNTQFITFSFSYTVGNVLLLILILNFFLSLMNSESVLKFRQNILFWVSIGLLVYYLGSCPFYGLKNLLVYKHYKTLYLPYAMFVYILDSLMYLTFALSFIWGKPN